MRVPEPHVDECVASLETMRIGRFRCHPSFARFTNTGPIQGWLLVFPRTSVWITHAGKEPMLADASRAMLYNRGQEYTRGKIAEDGDRCEWLSYDPAIITDAIAPYDPAVAERPEQPFDIGSAPVDASTYALQRRAFERALRGGEPLPLEEAMVAILARVVGAAYRRGAKPPPSPKHGALVDAVKSIVLARLSDRMSLGEIARAVGFSPYHVARRFQAHVGMGVHAYRLQLRLRASLERVADGEDLTRLALDLGFGSHSHFTSAFTRIFGESPRAFRATLTMRKKMKASARLFARR